MRNTTESRIVESRGDLLAFTQYTFPEYKADPFHADVANHLNKVVSGEIDHLMLLVPPEHGGGELVSIRLPPYWLAHNPELPVMLVTHSAFLAHRNMRAARSVFESPQYKLIFPHIESDTINLRRDDWHILDGKGYVLAMGVGGATTGHGFGLGIIDDPISNWVAARSETVQERVWQWWLNLFKTRIFPDGRIVLKMNRWGNDDLAGRIIKGEGRVEDGGKWTVVEYPAFADHSEGLDSIGRKIGEPLAPSFYPIERLHEIRNNLGIQIWNAEYQQRPWEPDDEPEEIEP